MRILESAWAKAVFANAMMGIFGLVGSTMVARALGPVGRGDLAAAVVWSSLLFASFALPSVQAVVVLAVGKSRRQIMRSSLALIALSTAILVPAAFGINYWLFHDGTRALLGSANLFAIGLPIGLVAASGGALLLSEGREQQFWNSRLLASGGYAALVAILALSHRATVLTCVVAMVVASMLSAAYAAFRARPDVASNTQEQSITRELASFGITTNLAGLPYQLNQRFDQAVMVLIVPSAVLGTYVAAYAWGSIVMLLGGGLSSLFLQRSSRTDPADVDRRELLLGALRTTTVGLVLLAAAVIVVAPIGIPLLFGEAFRPAVFPAMVLAIAGVVLTLNLCLHEIARGFGHPDLGISAEFVGLGVTLLLLWVLLPRYGGMGAAIASLTAYSVTFVMLVVLIGRRAGNDFGRAIVPGITDARALQARLLGRRA